MTAELSASAAVIDALLRHHDAAEERLHLVASENRLALAARLPYLTQAAQRYAFPAPPAEENWAWPGRQDLVRIERETAARLGVQLGAEHVNLKAVSGVSALTIALSALARPGQTVWNIAEGDGGHGSTRFIGARLGLAMRSLPFAPDRFAVDVDRLADMQRGHEPPALVYLDPFMNLFPTDLAALREAVGPDTLIHVDASHPLGLIAGGAFQDPLREGADTLGGSTHKTYPGPHKGVLATNRPDLAARLDEHASHFVSHHHPADLAALAIASVLMAERGKHYAAATIANARRLAAALAEQGFTVCAEQRGFTACHQIWIDIAPLLAAEQAARLLFEAGIVVNAIPIPYLSAPAGLRLGVQEATWLGMDSAAMDHIAVVFAAVLRDRRDPAPYAKRVRALLDRHRDDDGAQLAAHTVRQLMERRR
jgi:glycine hydroxymethyltransferase